VASRRKVRWLSTDYTRYIPEDSTLQTTKSSGQLTPD
jgi:hypothetical protein